MEQIPFQIGQFKIIIIDQDWSLIDWFKYDFYIHLKKLSSRPISISNGKILNDWSPLIIHRSDYHLKYKKIVETLFKIKQFKMTMVDQNWSFTNSPIIPI